MSKKLIKEVTKEIKTIEGVLDHFNRKIILDGTLKEFLQDKKDRLLILQAEEKAFFHKMSEKDQDSQEGEEAEDYCELLEEAIVELDEIIESLGPDYHMDDVRDDIYDIVATLEDIIYEE